MYQILFGLGSAILNACCKIILRAVMREGADAMAIALLTQIGAAALLLVLVEIPSFRTLDAHSYLFLSLSGALWAFSSYFDIRSHAELDAAVNSILGGARYVLLVVASVVIVGDSLHAMAYFGIALIIASIALTTNLSQARVRRGVGYRVLSLLSCNAAIVNDKFLTSFVPIGTVTVAAFLTPMVVLLAVRPRRVMLIPKEVKRSRGLALLVPVLSAAIYYLFVKSFAVGPLVVTATLSQTTVIFTFLLSVLLLKERTDYGKRVVASLLCALGAVLVSR